MENFDTSLNASEFPIEPPVGSHSYTIGGVQVIFPYRAYPSQLSMMDKIIRCLSKKQNCLLESPTGSGKSLALLCAALAWQRKRKGEIEKLMEELQCLAEQPIEIEQPQTDIKIENPKTESETSLQNSNNYFGNLREFSYKPPEKKMKYENSDKMCWEDDDDFKPPKIFQRQNQFKPHDGVFHQLGEKITSIKPTTGLSHTSQACASPITIVTSKETIGNIKIDSNHSCAEDVVQKLPKIYFGTRTHKQISQIIRELKKTPYKDTKMSILSSRDRTCIHPTLQNSSNHEKQEGCRDLLNAVGGPACQYYKNHKQISHSNPYTLSLAWDIEDLITKLKRMRACPYFSARALAERSDIIFCPYNYLVDPLIRSSLSIDLNDSIVIMDEAHNLEDSAREAASFTMQLSQIIETIGDLTRKAPSRKNKKSFETFSEILTKIAKWMEEWDKLLTSANSFDAQTKVFAGQEMIVSLCTFGCEEAEFKFLQECFAAIQSEESEIGQDEDADDKVKLSGSSMILLKGFMLILGYIYKEGMKHISDYRCVILKKNPVQSSPLFWKKGQAKTEFSINFWCLNPAVAISDVKEAAHSIIVTSGTLSPMSSFQSELDIAFDIKLEANHVVSRSQMWVGTIGHGPKGNILNATYNNSETFVFQDEIGHLVLEVCSIIPHGVLCFMPSYNMLDKLTTRWRTTGLWNHLSLKKNIMCEPRGQRQNFDSVMNDFYNAVKESEIGIDSNTIGALFIAVCRGKVSEGLDFADNNARAVITIGIPFPNLKDSQVELKRKYNNSLCTVNGIMSGSEWYETQAFRALNQALGRCIRHRNDFGALIIVDDRFQKQVRYVNSLSKWIRKEIVHYPTFNQAMGSLKEFSEKCGLITVST